MSHFRFSIWLVEELHRRHWTVSEFGKRSGINPCTLSSIIHNHRKMGLKVGKKLAKGLDIPTAVVLCLYENYEIPNFLDETTTEAINIMKDLPEKEKKQVLTYIQLIRQLVQQDIDQASEKVDIKFSIKPVSDD